MTTPTKTQKEAAERRKHLKKFALKALTKTPRAMSEIIARLEEFAAKPKTPGFGSPTATRVRSVLAELVDEGAVKREGNRRTTVYSKA